MPPIPANTASPGWPSSSPAPSSGGTVSMQRTMSTHGTAAFLGARMRTTQSGAMGSSRLGSRPYVRGELRRSTEEDRWPDTARPLPSPEPSLTRPIIAARPATGTGQARSVSSARSRASAVRRSAWATGSGTGSEASSRCVYGCCGIAEHLLAGALLDQPAVVEHRDPVGEQVDDGEVVADEQRREAEPGLQLGEQLEHPRLHRDVQRGGRLVGDQQLGVQGEGPGEAGALALPAAQLVRVAVPVRARQLDRLEQLVDAAAGRRAGRRRARARPAARRRTRRWSAAG